MVQVSPIDTNIRNPRCDTADSVKEVSALGSSDKVEAENQSVNSPTSHHGSSPTSPKSNGSTCSGWHSHTHGHHHQGRRHHRIASTVQSVVSYIDQGLWAQVEKEGAMSRHNVMIRQKFLFLRAGLIAGLACLMTVILALLQALIEKVLVGWSSLDLQDKYKELVESDPSVQVLEANKQIYRERMKGIDMAILLLWCLVGYLVGKMFLVNYYLNLNEVQTLRKLLLQVVVSVTTTVSLLLYCYYVVNNKKFIVTVAEVSLVSFFTFTFTSVLVLTLRKGINKKWPRRIFFSLQEAILVWMIAMASSFYLVLNKISEASDFLNILLMSLGCPLIQFMLRIMMERLVKTVYSKSNTAATTVIALSVENSKSRIETSATTEASRTTINLGPVTLLMEVLLIVPSFVVMLQVDSDLSCYTSILLSLVFEIAELIPMIKFRQSITINRHELSLSFGTYIANLEQAEKLALFAGIGLNMYAYGFSVRLLSRSLFAIVVEGMADILKEYVCFYFGVKTSHEHVQSSWKCIIIYTSFCSVGLFLALGGMSYTQYIL